MLLQMYEAFNHFVLKANLPLNTMTLLCLYPKEKTKQTHFGKKKDEEKEKKKETSDA